MMIRMNNANNESARLSLYLITLNHEGRIVARVVRAESHNAARKAAAADATADESLARAFMHPDVSTCQRLADTGAVGVIS